MWFLSLPALRSRLGRRPRHRASRSPQLAVGLDAFTVGHVQHNRASTGDPNIAGAYVVIP